MPTAGPVPGHVRTRLVIAWSVVLGLTLGCFLPSNQGAPATATAPTAESYPPDPSFDHSPDEAEAFIARETEGYAPVGAPVEARLEAFQPWQVQLQRGYCYRMAVRLVPGSQISEHARRGISFVYSAPGEPEVHGGPGFHGPGAVASAGCPQRDHAATFDMRAIFGSATDQSRVHDLGTGKLVAQLLQKPITEEELAAQEAERQRQIAESERFAREQEERERQAALEREQRWQQQREQQAAAPPSSGPPAPSGPVSVTLRNSCRETVPLFFGDNPGFGSGTYSSLSSNTVTSRSFSEGDMIWIVDDSRRGISSVTVSRGSRTIEITSACTGFVTR